MLSICAARLQAQTPGADALAAADSLADSAGRPLGDALQMAVVTAGEAVPATPSADKLETIIIEATRLGGPEVSPTGANDYAVTSQDINSMPAGDVSPISDVLSQMPGVAIDQNQQIHIRNTEGPQFQYQGNGQLIPFKI